MTNTDRADKRVDELRAFAADAAERIPDFGPVFFADVVRLCDRLETQGREIERLRLAAQFAADWFEAPSEDGELVLDQLNAALNPSTDTPPQASEAGSQERGRTGTGGVGDPVTASRPNPRVGWEPEHGLPIQYATERSEDYANRLLRYAAHLEAVIEWFRERVYERPPANPSTDTPPQEEPK
jgi:hypothetical protein